MDRIEEPPGTFYLDGCILYYIFRNEWAEEDQSNWDDHGIYLTVKHIDGRATNIADLLSRWFTTPNNQEKLMDLLSNHTWTPAHIDWIMFNKFI